jgi:hypothetical protein
MEDYMVLSDNYIDYLIGTCNYRRLATLLACDSYGYLFNDRRLLNDACLEKINFFLYDNYWDIPGCPAKKLITSEALLQDSVEGDYHLILFESDFPYSLANQYYEQVYALDNDFSDV